MRFRIESQSSRFTARAFAGGALSAMGHNPTFAIREFTGEVEFHPDEPTSSSLRLVVKAASLTLVDNVSDKDRREIERTTHEEVLESARFPDIVFECPGSGITAVGPMQFTLSGQLTLHGVTRPQTASVRVYPTGDTLRGQGEATVRQSDYGIRLVSVAGGMLKVKDEVKVTCDIVTRRVGPKDTAAAEATGAVPSPSPAAS